MKKLATSVSLALLSGLMFAAPAMADEFHYVVKGGLSMGGDDWQVAKQANGTPVYVHGGGLIDVGAGGYWAPSNYPLAVTVMANYSYDSGAGTRGSSAKFERTPVDAMIYYTGLKTVRFGVGAGYVISPTVKAQVDGSEQSIKFKNTTSAAFEAGYLIRPDMWLNLRLSSATFKPKNGGNAEKQDVSQLGVNLSYLF